MPGIRIILTAEDLHGLGPLPCQAAPPDTTINAPPYDVLARDDGKREVKIFPDHHCNWLQIQENTADSTHTFYLHGIMDSILGLKHPFAPYYRRPIEKLEFNGTDWHVVSDYLRDLANPKKDGKDPENYINFVNMLPTGFSAKVTLNLKNISLLKAIDYSCQQAGLRFVIDTWAVIIDLPQSMPGK